MAEIAGREVRVSTLQHEGPKLVALAVAGDMLATCDDAGRVEVRAGVLTGTLVPVAAWVEESDISEVSLAPSGRSVLLRSHAGDIIQARAATNGEPLMRLEGEIAGVPLAVAAIVSTPDRELMIISLERMRLQVRDMQTGELLHDEIVDRPRGFLYRFFVPMEDGDTVVAIGSYAGEMKDSLVALSLRRLLVEEGYLPRAVSRPAMTDYAYRLAAGPCGPSAAIFYRDPEDDEQMDDEDSADSNRLDIHGVCGLYVRRLTDRAVLETVPIDAAVPSGAALAGTDHHVVVAIREGALIVPRSRAPATLLPGRPLAVDTRTPQCVLASDDGALRLLTVS